MRRLLPYLTLFITFLWLSVASATVTTTFLKSGPYVTDGSAVVFAITFQYIEDTDIIVQLVQLSTGTTTTLVQNSDYTVTDSTSSTDDGTLPGGAITIQPNAASGTANGLGQFPSGYTLTITRGLALEQAESYPANGIFPSAATEQALDRLTLIAQQQQLLIGNTIQFPSTDPGGLNYVLPAAAQRASSLLSFDASGNVTTTTTATAGVSSIIATSPLARSSPTGNVTVSIGTVIPQSLGGTGTTTPSLVAGSNITIGGVWPAQTINASGTVSVNIGTTLANANPMKSGDSTTGLASLAASQLSIAAGGVQAMQFNTIASGVDYLSETAGKNGTTPILAVAGTTTNQGLALNMKGTGALALTGNETISGTLAVTGSETVGSTLGVTGAETVGGALGVTGNTTLTTMTTTGLATLSSATVPTRTAGDSTTNAASTAFVNSTALTLATGSTATTQTPGDNTTKVATDAFVAAAFNAVTPGFTSCTQVSFNNSGGTNCASGSNICAEASCAGGYTMTGGGCLDGGTTMIKSYPFNSNTWECVGQGAGQQTTYAVCCH